MKKSGRCTLLGRRGAPCAALPRALEPGRAGLSVPLPPLLQPEQLLVFIYLLFFFSLHLLSNETRAKLPAGISAGAFLRHCHPLAGHQRGVCGLLVPAQDGCSGAGVAFCPLLARRDSEARTRHWGGLMVRIPGGAAHRRGPCSGAALSPQGFPHLEGGHNTQFTTFSTNFGACTST